MTPIHTPDSSDHTFVRVPAERNLDQQIGALQARAVRDGITILVVQSVKDRAVPVMKITPTGHLHDPNTLWAPMGHLFGEQLLRDHNTTTELATARMVSTVSNATHQLRLAREHQQARQQRQAQARKAA